MKKVIILLSCILLLTTVSTITSSKTHKVNAYDPSGGGSG
jgi:hypothetical protein